MKTDKRKAIALLLTAFSKANDDADDMKELIDIYEYALEGVSDMNVKTSVSAFMQGRVANHNKAFRPSPAELAAYARPLQMVDDRIGEIVTRLNDRIPESKVLRLERQKARSIRDE